MTTRGSPKWDLLGEAEELEGGAQHRPEGKTGAQPLQRPVSVAKNGDLPLGSLGPLDGSVQNSDR